MTQESDTLINMCTCVLPHTQSCNDILKCLHLLERADLYLCVMWPPPPWTAENNNLLTFCVFIFISKIITGLIQGPTTV